MARLKISLILESGARIGSGKRRSWKARAIRGQSRPPLLLWAWIRSANIIRPTGFAFGLLAAIGAKMIWDSMRRREGEGKSRQHSFGVLVFTAVGTSIDAMAVGMTLALLDADIIVNALAIGMATFAMTTMGVLVGRFLGGRFGRFAEAAGGVGLFPIGTKILVEHTMLG
jgi:putative Mn2+ efflux pump MntP